MGAFFFSGGNSRSAPGNPQHDSLTAHSWVIERRSLWRRLWQPSARLRSAVGSGDLALNRHRQRFDDNIRGALGRSGPGDHLRQPHPTERAVPAANLANVQTAQITVFTPAPGGGTSNVLAFFVTQATAGVTSQDVASGEDKTASAGPATATATGDGLLVVAQYDANPGGTPSFSASGTLLRCLRRAGEHLQPGGDRGLRPERWGQAVLVGRWRKRG